MFCLSNTCYVCLEKNDKSLININNSLPVNKDIIHIIDYLPCNLGWMKTKQIILICEECCRRLRETYQFLVMCDKNSAVMQGYMAEHNTANIAVAGNAAELRVDLSNQQDDINEPICEIKVEDKEIYTVEKGPLIEETEYEFVNVKEEGTWRREEVDDEEEPPMDNNSTESSNNDTHSDSAGFTSTQAHTTNKKKPNTAVARQTHKCLTCGKAFSWKSQLDIHTRIHRGAEKLYKCATCGKCFRYSSGLRCHVRIHTGEKPYECSICQKCFRGSAGLMYHMRIHNGEKPYKCDACEKCFRQKVNLLAHTLTHTGEKPYKCSRCNASFRYKRSSVHHLKKCEVCSEDFCSKKELDLHVLVHADQ